MSSPLPKMHFRGSGRSSSLVNVPSASNYQPNTGQGVTMLGNTIISNEKRNHPMREKNSQAGRSSPSGYQQQPQQVPNLHQARDLSPYGFANQQQHYPGLGYEQTLPMNHQVLSPIPLSHSNPLLAPRGSIASPFFMSDPAGYNPQSKITPIAFNLGYQPAPGSQHYYGAPIIVKGRKDKEEKKDKKKKKEKEEKNVDIKPLESLLGQYLDRQNQLMARIFRDIEDDKKRENLKQAYLKNSPDFGHGNDSNSDSPGRRSLPNSPGKHARSSSLIPLKNTIPSQTRLTQEDDLSPNPFIRRRLDGLNTDISNKLLRKDSEIRNQFLRKPNRMRGRKLLKQFAWGLALPSLWFLSVVKWSEQRRESELKVLRDEIPEHLETFLEFAAIGIEKEIRSFVTDKNSMVLVQSFTPKPAELDKRCKTISEHLILILDHLSLKMDSGKLPPSFFEFLAALSEDDAVLPDNFLSGFEIPRLAFNMFGNLKNMEEWRSKMILACFLLIKGVLYFLMLRPWTVIPSVLEKQVNFRNILNAGSVLYHITLDALSEYVPESKNFRSQEVPFEAAPPTFSAFEANKLQKLDVLPEANEDDPSEVISGFYSRGKLSEFLDERPKMVKEVRASVLDFLDVLYDLTHNALEPKWHVKRMFADFRPKK